jgi:hypothetical protein
VSDQPPVTLDFLAKQQRQLLAEMAAYRDDMTVLTAITARVEASVSALITEVRAMHSRHARLERRVGTLEGNEAD